MNVAVWIGLSVTVAGLVFLGFVVAGMLRSMDDLRARLDGIDHATPRPADRLATGLAVGEAAPTVEGSGIDRRRFSSSSLDGARHLVVFADPDCAACARLVPDLVRDSPLPGVIVTDASAVPHSWRPPEAGRIALVLDGGAIAERYATDLRPSVFVVDEGGGIVGRASAETVEELRELVRDTTGVRVVEEPREAADG